MTAFTAIGLCTLSLALWLASTGWFLLARRRIGTVAPATGGGPELPLISVIVPARDEAGDLAAGLRSILDQQDVDLEVIVVNDHSRDGTGAIADDIARHDPRVRVIHDPPLAKGWLGKANAMQAGAAQARGALLLFTDADIRHRPHSFRTAGNLLQQGACDLVSLLPRFEMGPFWENVMMPMYIAGFAHLVAPFGQPVSDGPAVASGALMLIRAEVFHRIGGFAPVRAAMADDVGLARHLTGLGCRVKAALAPECLSVRMFKTNRHAFWGTTKNILMIAEGNPWRALLAPPLTILLFWTPPAALAAGMLGAHTGLAVAGGAAYLLQYLLLFAGRGLIHARPLPLLAFPLVVVVVTACTLRAAYFYGVKGAVVWRGRAVRVR